MTVAVSVCRHTVIYIYVMASSYILKRGCVSDEVTPKSWTKKLLEYSSVDFVTQPRSLWFGYACLVYSNSVNDNGMSDFTEGRM